MLSRWSFCSIDHSSMCWSRVGHFGAKGAIDARIKSCLLKWIELDIKTSKKWLSQFQARRPPPTTQKSANTPCSWKNASMNLKMCANASPWGSGKLRHKVSYQKEAKNRKFTQRVKIWNSIITSLVQISYHVVPIGQTPKSKILPRRGNVLLFQKCNFPL